MLQKINTHTNTHTLWCCSCFLNEGRHWGFSYILYVGCHMAPELNNCMHSSIHTCKPIPTLLFFWERPYATRTHAQRGLATQIQKSLLWVCFECCVPHNEWHSCAHVHANTHPSQVPQTADPGLCILKRNNGSHSFITFCKNISPPTAIIRWTFSFHSGHILF